MVEAALGWTCEVTRSVEAWPQGQGECYSDLLREDAMELWL